MNNNLPNWFERHINIFDNEQIHHAFIISGSKGIGKSLLIENLAEKILNSKISLENNPDFHNLKILAEKKLIGINQIHELRSKLYESSFLGKNKVAVINEIEKISIDGLNAILKILEEPPKNTYFLLSTNFLNQIPLTIQSRCFDLRISSPEIKQSLEWLSGYQTKDALKALESVNEDESQLLLNNTKTGRVLAQLGAYYHITEQAVTSQGLHRSALENLEKHLISPRQNLIYSHCLDLHASLLRDWDNREADARTLFTKAEDVRTNLTETFF